MLEKIKLHCAKKEQLSINCTSYAQTRRRGHARTQTEEIGEGGED